MTIQTFFDPRTWTLTHVAFDEGERVGAVIDPVLDFDATSGRTWTESADSVARFLDQEQRDSTLSMPALILPSIQLNVRAGRFPEPEENGISYLNLPLNAFGGKS